VTPPDDAKLLLAVEPRRLAQSALDLLMALCCSRGGAVFACGRGGALQLITSSHLDQAVLDWARADWEAVDLSTGFFSMVAHEGRRFIMLPCFRDGAPTGFAYLDCEVPAAPPKERLALLQELLGEATAPLPTAPAPREKVSPGVAERERLLFLLHQNEWNVSRVARILRVTRATVYHRLERFEIKRRRVMKARLV
jgi:transcriptional regulator with GAF, ATPase, and Fis domain